MVPATKLMRTPPRTLHAVPKAVCNRDSTVAKELLDALIGDVVSLIKSGALGCTVLFDS